MAGGKRAAGFIVYRLMGNSRQYLLMQEQKNLQIHHLDYCHEPVVSKFFVRKLKLNDSPNSSIYI